MARYRSLEGHTEHYSKQTLLSSHSFTITMCSFSQVHTRDTSLTHCLLIEVDWFYTWILAKFRLLVSISFWAVTHSPLYYRSIILCDRIKPRNCQGSRRVDGRLMYCSLIMSFTTSFLPHRKLVCYIDQGHACGTTHCCNTTRTGGSSGGRWFQCPVLD